ncbi:MAG: hypothetical protein FWF15_06275, partial [Oscillospiraceae bacterium]|nr:hypothetical protein [Oscillospiraceae bacterium]
EPLKGRRYVCASERRTKKDWAEQIRILLDEHYPAAPKVCLTWLPVRALQLFVRGINYSKFLSVCQHIHIQ